MSKLSLWRSAAEQGQSEAAESLRALPPRAGSPPPRAGSDFDAVRCCLGEGAAGGGAGHAPERSHQHGRQPPVAPSMEANVPRKVLAARAHGGTGHGALAEEREREREREETRNKSERQQLRLALRRRCVALTRVGWPLDLFVCGGSLADLPRFLEGAARGAHRIGLQGVRHHRAAPREPRRQRQQHQRFWLRTV